MLKEVSVEVIRTCPNNCLHCSSFSSCRCTEKMPFKTFAEVVSDAKTLGASTICLSGGEPFLHEDIVKMVELIHSSGLDCFIYSSGIVFDKQSRPSTLSEDLLKKINRSVTKIIFNVEAGTEKTYNKIMGTFGCFELMQQSAILAHQAGICTEAHFVPMALNIDEIDDVIQLCKKIHISKLSFLRLVLHGRAKENGKILALTDEEISRVKARLNSLHGQDDVAFRVGVPLSMDMSCHRCEAANGKLNIRYDGKVYPCEVFKNCDMEISLNGLKPESIYDKRLVEIYRNSKYLARVREISADYNACENCETCVGQYLLKREEKNNG